MHNSDETIFSLKSAFAAGTHCIHKNDKQKLTACQNEPHGIKDSLFDSLGFCGHNKQTVLGIISYLKGCSRNIVGTKL